MSTSCFSFFILLFWWQFHNANQLAAWCLHHICTHYNRICANYRKEIKSKSPGKSISSTIYSMRWMQTVQGCKAPDMNSILLHRSKYEIFSHIQEVFLKQQLTQIWKSCSLLILLDFLFPYKQNWLQNLLLKAFINTLKWKYGWFYIGCNYYGNIFVFYFWVKNIYIIILNGCFNK